MQCVARDSSCDHATCPQRTFDENSQHSASNTVQLGSARKFIGTGAVRASIYSLSLSSRLVSKSMDKMQLDTKSRSGSGKRKMTLMSLFNPFQSFSILFNQGKLRFQVSRKMRTFEDSSQSICPRMVFLSQRPKVIQRSGIRRLTHGRRINSVPDAKHQRIGTMRKWEAHGSTMQSEKTISSLVDPFLDFIWSLKSFTVKFHYAGRSCQWRPPLGDVAPVPGPAHSNPPRCPRPQRPTGRRARDLWWLNWWVKKKPDWDHFRWLSRTMPTYANRLKKHLIATY